MLLQAAYRFSNQVSASPPPAGGEVHLDTLAQAQATALYVSNLDAYGVDRSGVWAGLVQGGEVVLAAEDATRQAHYLAAGNPTLVQYATHVTVPVIVVDVSGLFADGEPVTAAVEYTPAAPSLDDVRAWLNIPATQVTDEQMAQVIDAELRLQGAACRYPLDATGRPALTPDLTQALYRRVGREVAAKGLPLGVMGADSEYGPSRLSRWDAEIDRLEGPRRVVVFG